MIPLWEITQVGHYQLIIFKLWVGDLQMDCRKDFWRFQYWARIGLPIEWAGQSIDIVCGSGLSPLGAIRWMVWSMDYPIMFTLWFGPSDDKYFRATSHNWVAQMRKCYDCDHACRYLIFIPCLQENWWLLCHCQTKVCFSSLAAYGTHGKMIRNCLYDDPLTIA